MFKIMATVKTLHFEIDRDLSFGEACHMAEVYKTKNPNGFLEVVNQNTGDTVYEVY